MALPVVRFALLLNFSSDDIPKAKILLIVEVSIVKISRPIWYRHPSQFHRKCHLPTSVRTRKRTVVAQAGLQENSWPSEFIGIAGPSLGEEQQKRRRYE